MCELAPLVRRPPNAIPAQARSEPPAAAEAEHLRPVVGLLGQRETEVEAQRPKRRSPDDADAARGADFGGVGDADRSRIPRIHSRTVRTVISGSRSDQSGKNGRATIAP